MTDIQNIRDPDAFEAIAEAMRDRLHEQLLAAIKGETDNQLAFAHVAGALWALSRAFMAFKAPEVPFEVFKASFLALANDCMDDVIEIAEAVGVPATGGRA